MSARGALKSRSTNRNPCAIPSPARDNPDVPAWDSLHLCRVDAIGLHDVTHGPAESAHGQVRGALHENDERGGAHCLVNLLASVCRKEAGGRGVEEGKGLLGLCGCCAGEEHRRGGRRRRGGACACGETLCGRDGSRSEVGHVSRLFGGRGPQSRGGKHDPLASLCVTPPGSLSMCCATHQRCRCLPEEGHISVCVYVAA